MTDEKVNPQLTRAIIGQQMAEWRAALENMRIQNAVAQHLQDPQERLDQIRTQVERCVKAIEFLESKLAELPKDDAPIIL